MSRFVAVIGIGLLLAGSACAAGDTVPAPKPPTYEELVKQNKDLQHQILVQGQMLNGYRMRAVQAEDQLMQLNAEKNVSGAPVVAPPK